MSTSFVADTPTRVSRHTDPEVNEQLRNTAEAEIMHAAVRPERIAGRLAELDREWDIERVLEFNYAAVNLVGLTLGARWPRWYWLPVVAGGFMLMHVIQGWCPPVPVFRRLGVRTTREIDQERCALMALRGDFGGLQAADDPVGRARLAIRAAGMQAGAAGEPA
jgi:hypothetical protein